VLRGCEEAFFYEEAAKIQAVVRGKLQVFRYRQATAALHLLQKVGRCLGPRRALKHAKRNAATLQRVVRGKQQARKYAAWQQASVVVQARMRGHVARLHFGRDAELRMAAISIQKQIRGVVYYRRGQRRLVVARAAASTLTRASRVRMAVVEVRRRRVLKQEKDAATVMQGMARQRTARQELSKRQEARKAMLAATQIQAQARQRAAAKVLKCGIKAAVTLQAGARAGAARKVSQCASNFDSSLSPLLI